MPHTKAHHAALEWKFREFEPQHDRGTLWYLITGSLVGLLLVYSFFTVNYLFAILVLITVLVLFSHQVFTPPVIHIKITDEGILLNDRQYRFREFEYFWIVSDEDAGRVLYLHLRKGLGSILSLPIPPKVTISSVREVVGEHVEENEEYTAEPFWDHMARKLKI